MAHELSALIVIPLMLQNGEAPHYILFPLNGQLIAYAK